VAAFRGGGGDGKPMVLQVHVSWAPTYDEALAVAHDQWRTNVFQPPVPWELTTVAEFDEAARHVRPEDMPGSVLVSEDPGRFVQWVREAAELGFDPIVLHHVGQEQQRFLETFGERVLPELRS
jgi:alkanesulfonate monooxygenase SsuD/methylene tetrahydromethanopterin reductase-like flavin-dependent oxidoreductase (luciferase family)